MRFVSFFQINGPIEAIQHTDCCAYWKKNVYNLIILFLINVTSFYLAVTYDFPNYLLRLLILNLICTLGTYIVWKVYGTFFKVHTIKD